MLLLVAIIALVTAIAFCFWKLTATVDAGGYGMTVGQFFEALPKLPK